MTARERAEALARAAHHAPVIATDCPSCVADIATAIESAVAEARAEERERWRAALEDLADTLETELSSDLDMPKMCPKCGGRMTPVGRQLVTRLLVAECDACAHKEFAPAGMAHGKAHHGENNHADPTARERAEKIFKQGPFPGGLYAAIEAAILEAERAAVARVLTRLGDVDVQEAIHKEVRSCRLRRHFGQAIYAAPTAEGALAITRVALAAVRALLEKENAP